LLAYKLVNHLKILQEASEALVPYF
jgi:hypothetical protein